MWNNNNNNNDDDNNKGGGGDRKVAVAIDKNKRSRGALKWALDNILTVFQTVSLIHVQSSLLSSNNEITPRNEDTDEATDFILPFRCFCSRRQVQWETVILEEQDISKALIDYVSFNRIDTLVLSAPARSSISRLFKTDIPSMVLKGAPHFCNVYVISKGKVASFRAASHPVPLTRTLGRKGFSNITVHDELGSLERASNVRGQDEWSIVEGDHRYSYISSQGRMSTRSNGLSFYNNLGSDLDLPPRSFSDVGRTWGSKFTLSDLDAPIDLLSSIHRDNSLLACSMTNDEEVEEKMRRLELQKEQTMEMYHAACKEALAAKRKAREFQLLKIENDKRLVEAEKAKQEMLATIAEEKEKREVAFKLAKAAYRKADREAHKRAQAELKASEEAEKKEMIIKSLNQSHGLLRQQSLLHVVIVFFLFYIYFF